jgi:Asp/Glu/hydantoin racemase
MLERLALALGFATRLASVRTIEMTGAQAAADPDNAVQVLADACRAAQDEEGAGAVILGGAGFAGLGTRVAESAGIEVIDSVHAGARAAERLALGAPWLYTRREGLKPTPSTGLDALLADKLFD